MRGGDRAIIFISYREKRTEKLRNSPNYLLGVINKLHCLFTNLLSVWFNNMDYLTGLNYGFRFVSSKCIHEERVKRNLGEKKLFSMKRGGLVFPSVLRCDKKYAIYNFK